MSKKSFIVSAKEEKTSLLTFLSTRIASSKRSLKQAIDQGALFRNGKIERFASTSLCFKDHLIFDVSKLLLQRKKKSLALKLLYEEEEFLICYKPSGLLTDRHLFEKQLQGNLYLVHRLDKLTSGLILIAKNREMGKRLEGLFRKREVEKTYLAVVKGTMKKKSGIIRGKLKKIASFSGQSILATTRDKQGRLAITSWECLKKNKKNSLLLCKPQTGRMHQLRVHLSEMGHPILGDYQYGRTTLFPSKVTRLCLHAFHLAFMHPKTHKKICIKSPMPSLFKSLMS